MNESTNGHSNVIQLLDQLREKKSSIEKEIAATEQVLNLLGVEHAEDVAENTESPVFAPPRTFTPRREDQKLVTNLRGMTPMEACFTWAKANGNIIRCADLARAMFNQGVGG